MTADELKTILEKHAMWLRGEEGGSRADLARAYLADADLADADLTDADLADADLTGADLADAKLTDADLADADLTGANLVGADLVGADLGGANLDEPTEPYVSAATPEQRRARDLARAERYRTRHPEVPMVEHLDARILEAITVGGGALNMSHWHSCETTHCRAGWAITLAGDAGKQLEAEHGPRRAGSMIYRASTGRVPYFFASTEQALEDIRNCAAEATDNQP